MAKPRSNLRNLLEYWALRLFAMFVHMFRVETNYVTARLMGDVMYLLDRRHRRIAHEHLRLSFPDWDEPTIRRVARQSMRHMVYLVVDMLFTPRLITPTTRQRYIRLHNMVESLRRAVRQERGMIFVTGHFGNWEISGYMMATLGFPVVSVARPLDNPLLNQYLLGVRERTGQTILDKKGAVDQVDRILTDRGSLAFIADQDAGRRGMFVDFFGRAASTFKTIALVAARYEVPVVVAYTRRVGAFRFEVGVQRIIDPSEWAGEDDPIRWLTQEYTRELENAVRRAPEQYLWLHRRWKHRPDGTTAPGGIA